MATDPLTGESFVRKRSNQRFANRRNQVRYNNEKAASLRKLKSEVDRHLAKNRKILIECLGNEEEVTRTKEFLRGAGFHFGCHTHLVQRDNTSWYCVYDYAYKPINNESVRITKHA